MIKHKNRIKQVIDFSGVGDSKIHPTDIDAVLEFDDKYLLLFEVKYKGQSISFDSYIDEIEDRANSKQNGKSIDDKSIGSFSGWGKGKLKKPYKS